MDAVIIAAGRGTRMRPLTDTRPKPLLPIGDTTLLERIAQQAAPVVDRFVLVVGYRSDQIRDAIGEECAGRPLEYVEQPEQLGTAHAIGQVSDIVNDRFLVLNGDVIVAETVLEELAGLDGHAIAGTHVEDPTAYGVLETAGDRLTGIHEKPTTPPSSLANIGLYAFEPSVFEAIEQTPESPRGEYELTDTIDILLTGGESVSVLDYDGTWLDVGRPWELLEANAIALETLPRQINGTVEDGATLTGAVRVAEGARIRDGAYIEGPAIIQAGADIGPNAYVRGSSRIGPNVRIGNAVEIKNSIIMADTNVGHLSYVGDSILGAEVNFGAGTTVANLRHDEQAIRMQIKGEAVDTGRRKLGVVVGDRTKTGIDTSLNAGVKLNVGTRTMPDETVLRDP